VPDQPQADPGQAQGGVTPLQAQNLGTQQGKAAVFTMAASRFVTFRHRNRGMFIACSGVIDD
jgi:hypothetical protein